MNSKWHASSSALCRCDGLPLRYSEPLDPTPDIWYTLYRWIMIHPTAMGKEAMMVNSVDRKVIMALAKDSTVQSEPAQIFRSPTQGVRLPVATLETGLHLTNATIRPNSLYHASWCNEVDSFLMCLAADLEAAESAFGAFHPTTWHFRNSLAEAQRSWEQLRAELGTRIVEGALEQPPLTTLVLWYESTEYTTGGCRHLDRRPNIPSSAS